MRLVQDYVVELVLLEIVHAGFEALVVQDHYLVVGQVGEDVEGLGWAALD